MAERPIKHVSRGRRLTPEEAAKYKMVRAQIAKDVPALMAKARQVKAEIDARDAGPDREDLAAAVAVLRDERMARGIALAHVAAAIGMDPAALSRLESGSNLNPTFRILNNWARFFGHRVIIE